jgi:hypothetical protein
VTGRAQPADDASASKYHRASRWRRPVEIGDDAPVCFVVYRGPRDFNGYVMRAFGVEGASLTPLDYVTAGTLEACRAMIPPEATRARGRAPDDAECLFEVWF